MNKDLTCVPHQNSLLPYFPTSMTEFITLLEALPLSLFSLHVTIKTCSFARSLSLPPPFFLCVSLFLPLSFHLPFSWKNFMDMKMIWKYPYFWI